MNGSVLRSAIALSLLASFGGVQAGTFLDFNSNPATVVHPTGYSGTGGERTISVCLDPAALPLSGDPDQAIRNALATFNQLEPTPGNVVAHTNGTDFETVLLHEVGHCIGMDHSALGPSETCDATGDSFDSPHIYFANSIASATSASASCNGEINVFSTNAGADGVRGTRDDIRGGDVNRNWFRRNVNDPFELPGTTVDRSTHSVSLTDLPTGHAFAEVSTSFGPCNGSQPNSSGLRGQPATQNTMFPVSCSNNVLRKLAPDDVTTLRIARAGNDGVQGTADDYTVRLNYIGQATTCDIKIQFVDNAGFAFCQVGASFVNGDISITSASARFQNTVNWFYNQEDTTGAVSNVGPTIAAQDPQSGTSTALGGGDVGAVVTGSISFSVSGGSGTGTTSLTCSVGSGTVTIASGTPQTIGVDDTVAAVVPRFTLTDTAQTGVINCTATPQGGTPANFTYTFTAPAGNTSGGTAECTGDCVFLDGFEQQP